jgi:hypothetical protein
LAALPLGFSITPSQFLHEIYCLVGYKLSTSEMASREDPKECYPPSLTIAESEHILSTIKDWSIAHGLAVRPPPAFLSPEADPHGVLATTAPITLFPSPFPRVCFDQAKSVQKAYNQLYASIAQDEGFLGDIVQE